MDETIDSVKNVVGLDKITPEKRLEFVRDILDKKLEVTNNLMVEFLQEHFQTKPQTNPEKEYKVLEGVPAGGQVICMVTYNNTLYASVKQNTIGYLCMWDLMTGGFIKSANPWHNVYIRSMAIHDDKLYYGTNVGEVGYYNFDLSKYEEKKYDGYYTVSAMLSTGETLFINTTGGVYYGKDYQNLNALYYKNGSFRWTSAYSIVQHKQHIFVSRGNEIFKISLDGSNVELYRSIEGNSYICKLHVTSSNDKQKICAFTGDGYKCTWINKVCIKVKYLNNKQIWAAKEFQGKLYIGQEGEGFQSTEDVILHANAMVVHNQTLYCGGNYDKIYYITTGDVPLTI